MSATTVTVAEQIASRLHALDYEGLADLYRPDALLDANVPQWRFQLRGRDAIRQALLEEAAEHLRGCGRVSGWRVTRTGDGTVVELEVRFPEEAEERLWREVHLFHTDGEAITEHVIYCTGVWDADTIARQALETPMVAR